MLAQNGTVRASRFGALGFTIVALILTVMSALLLSNLMGDSKYASEQVTNVVVAKKLIHASERITDEHLAIAQFPISSIPEGAFHSKDDFLGPKPRVAVTTILAGEPILAPRLAEAAVGTGMAAQVPKDSRAYPLPIENWVASARLVYPGAMVDVLVTMTDFERRTITKTILQFVRVLAVDGATDAVMLAAAQEERKNKSTDRTVVTLLLSPDEAEMLALANREGKVDLILRNAQDDAVIETLGIRPAELLGQIDPNEVEAARAQLASEERAQRSAERRAKTRRPASSPDSDMYPVQNPVHSGGTKTIKLEAH